MSHLRRMAAAFIAAATIISSVSFTALAPLLARAAAPASGSLVKASMPAVYYVGADGKRYVFPNEKTYKTWYPDFSSVQVITDAELAALTIGGNVTYRPGVRMIKIQTDPKTYAVSHNGTLRWVKSEALAVSLYGQTWNQQIDDVSDAFFTNYTIGADINSASDYSPAAETAAATSINQDKNLANVLTVSGSLSVQLASTNPGPLTFVGGIGNSMLDFDVTNSSNQAVTLDSLTVHRSGAGALSDIAGLYLFHGWERVSSGRTINSTTNDAIFNNVGFVVAPHSTETISVIGSFNYSLGAGNKHALTLTDVRSGSTIAAGLPLQGSMMTMTSANSGLVTVNKSGSSPFANVRVGGPAQKIGEFRLTVDSTEEMDFYAANLTVGGTIGRTHLSNVVLKYGGNAVATAPGYDRFDRATLVLETPVHMERGASRTFEVYADVAPDTRATSSDTIFTYMDDVTDVTAIGNTFGYAAGVTTQTTYGGSYDGVGCVLGGGNCSSAGIEGGQITLTFNGPATRDLPTNGKDQELFNFTMASAANVEVRSTGINLNSTVGNLGSGAIAYYTDVKIVDTATGTVVAGPLDAPTAAANAATLTYTDIYTLNAGQSRTFKVTADVAATTPANNTVRATLNAFGGSAIRNTTNSTFIATTDIVPSTAMVGNLMTVKAPSLTVSTASTPVAQTYIQGSQGVALAGFNLKAGDSQDMKVTSLTVTCFVDGNLDAAFLQGQDTTGETKLCTDILQTAKLWNGTSQLGPTKSPTTSTAPGNGGLLQFTNLDLAVPKGQTLTVNVTGNLSGSIANLNDRIQLRVVAAGDVTTQDPDGNAVVAGGTFAVSGPQITIAASGTLAVALAPDDSESEAGLVIGGTSNVVLSKYRLTAQNEELKLTKARIGVTVAASTAISSISLYDGATLVGGPTAVDSNGHADFSGVNFVIPKDASKTLTVKASLNAVGPSGAASGTDLLTQLCEGLGGPCVSGLGSSDVGTFEVRGTSAGSSTLLTSFPGVDLSARTKILRKTKPTVSIVAVPSSTLMGGTVVISRFTVSADAGEQVALKKITFQSALNNTGGAALALSSSGADSNVREVGQGSNIAGAANYGAACATSGTCVIQVSFTNEQGVAAGTSKTYELRVTVAGADTAGESASTSLLGDTGVLTGWLSLNGGAVPAFTVDTTNDSTANGTATNFIWSDNAAVPHVDTNTDAGGSAFTGSGDWTNSNLVKVLPSDVQTMTRS